MASAERRTRRRGRLAASKRSGPAPTRLSLERLEDRRLLAIGDVLGTTLGSTAAESFGQAVAVGDGRVLVGAPPYNNVGRAYLYDTAGNLLRVFENPRPAAG